MALTDVRKTILWSVTEHVDWYQRIVPNPEARFSQSVARVRAWVVIMRAAICELPQGARFFSQPDPHSGNVISVNSNLYAYLLWANLRGRKRAWPLWRILLKENVDARGPLPLKSRIGFYQ